MELISRADAKSKGLKRYFTGRPCKHGHVSEYLVSNGTCCACNCAKVIEWQRKNPDKAKKRNDKWREANPGLAAKRANEWYYQNKDKHIQTRNEYFKKHPHLRAKLSSIQRAAQNKRTPGWLTEDDFWLMDEIYRLANLRTAMTGIEWHVDHIIPLRGKNVSGLHVPSNLRVIPKQLNLKKGNRYAVS